MSIALPGTRVSALGNVSDLQLVEHRGARIAGRIVSEGAAPVEFDLGTLRLTLETRVGGGGLGRTTGPGVQSDGTFSIDGVAGPTTLHIEDLSEGWSVKAVLLEGTDLRRDRLWRRPAAAGGGHPHRRGDSCHRRLRPSHRSPRPDRVGLYGRGISREPGTVGSAIAVRTRRSLSSGRIRIDALPPADYLAIAVEALPPSTRWVGPPSEMWLDWGDPTFLERSWGGATPFHLDEGEQRTLDLRLARTPVGR